MIDEEPIKVAIKKVIPTMKVATLRGARYSWNGSGLDGISPHQVIILF
jgi:hypothetical protein